MGPRPPSPLPAQGSCVPTLGGLRWPGRQLALSPQPGRPSPPPRFLARAVGVTRISPRLQLVPALREVPRAAGWHPHVSPGPWSHKRQIPCRSSSLVAASSSWSSPQDTRLLTSLCCDEANRGMLAWSLTVPPRTLVTWRPPRGAVPRDTLRGLGICSLGLGLSSAPSRQGTCALVSGGVTSNPAMRLLHAEPSALGLGCGGGSSDSREVACRAYFHVC